MKTHTVQAEIVHDLIALLQTATEGELGVTVYDEDNTPVQVVTVWVQVDDDKQVWLYGKSAVYNVGELA